MVTPQSNGYLAQPASGSGAPVLVLHAWWGLNETISSFCDRLAGEGFLAYAPDLYHGEVTDQISRADDLSGMIFEDLDRPRADLDRAVATLQEAASGASSMAALGFSLGAFFALDLSIRHPQLVNAVVTFYGTHPGDFDAASAAYLGHFAEIDEFEPPSEVDALEESLRSAGRAVEFYRYPGTGHWFFEPDRSDAYDSQAAALAWDRTLAFLKRHAS